MTELPPWETLAGWSRGHVLSHLARHADALVNLLTWARTGVEARMHASPAERADGIEAGSPQRIAGWLTGRSPGNGLAVTGGGLPDLPRWL